MLSWLWGGTLLARDCLPVTACPSCAESVKRGFSLTLTSKPWMKPLWEPVCSKQKLLAHCSPKWFITFLGPNKRVCGELQWGNEKPMNRHGDDEMVRWNMCSNMSSFPLFSIWAWYSHFYTVFCHLMPIPALICDTFQWFFKRHMQNKSFFFLLLILLFFHCQYSLCIQFMYA